MAATPQGQRASAGGAAGCGRPEPGAREEPAAPGTNPAPAAVRPAREEGCRSGRDRAQVPRRGLWRAREEAHQRGQVSLSQRNSWVN